MLSYFPNTLVHLLLKQARTTLQWKTAKLKKLLEGWVYSPCFVGKDYKTWSPGLLPHRYEELPAGQQGRKPQPSRLDGGNHGSDQAGRAWLLLEGRRHFSSPSMLPWPAATPAAWGLEDCGPSRCPSESHSSQAPPDHIICWGPFPAEPQLSHGLYVWTTNSGSLHSHRMKDAVHFFNLSCSLCSSEYLSLALILRGCRQKQLLVQTSIASVT